MKKVLASVVVAAIIIGGGVTYTESHPDKVVTTPATITTTTTTTTEKTNNSGNLGENNLTNLSTAVNANNYLGTWVTDKSIGSINGADSIGKTSKATINMNSKVFEVNDVFANNYVNHFSVNDPIYTAFKLPNNYFHISFGTEPSKLNISEDNSYQIMVNGAPTDLYVSNGQLLFNSDGTFFSLKKQ